MKTKKLIFISLLLTSFTIYYSYSQTVNPLPTLTDITDARYSGMGSAGTAIANDIQATNLNPGGLGFLRQTIIPGSFFSDRAEKDTTRFFEASYTYSEYPIFQNNSFGIHNISAGMYSKPLRGTVAVDFSYLELGEYTRTSDSGIVLGKFNSYEYNFGIAYGTTIGDDWGIGAKLKYINSNMEPPNQHRALDGVSFALDFGVLWQPHDLSVLGMELGDVISLGANLKNIGPKVTYWDESDPLPTQLRLGAGFNLLKNNKSELKLAVDITKLLVYRRTIISVSGNDSIYESSYDGLPKSLISGWNNPGVELGLGAEYWYKHHLALRAGYYTLPLRLGNEKYLTFGGSLRFSIFQADISYSHSYESNYPLNIMKLTLRYGG
ncbi:MAG: PorV/PorQ family protein [FCB group bacterium]